jgi:hypothetical protein
MNSGVPSLMDIVQIMMQMIKNEIVLQNRQSVQPFQATTL